MPAILVVLCYVTFWDDLFPVGKKMASLPVPNSRHLLNSSEGQVRIRFLETRFSDPHTLCTHLLRWTLGGNLPWREIGVSQPAFTHRLLQWLVGEIGQISWFLRYWMSFPKIYAQPVTSLKNCHWRLNRDEKSGKVKHSARHQAPLQLVLVSFLVLSSEVASSDLSLFVPFLWECS